MPIRDWNRDRIVGKSQNILGLLSAYKGLKHIMVIMLTWLEYVSLLSAYKGLKLFHKLK